ncbi:Rz1 family lipoprotein [Escherichia coli]|uniref:Rz1 family lipoprotein n=1 Tax=Escherichia coli TaxID=562 RepID=UPI002939A1F2|nr:Rz1 family lipoprotein [Escherichia coli]EHR8152651.1 Rz1 family lipoprotein [Escherichia coli]EJD8402281.1 Rz1 family lipoprotein [Escherichia coli]EKH3670502.1 Rz1 family lipoprotein [Escherichia coli]EKP9207585.1 Rz1 family lipoprotein [Escherichia coli]ELR1827090.1 Rz1 family lipoprotein [Escherichia coli]
MRELKMKICALMLPLVISACRSTPSVCPPQIKPPAPPAWIMESAPDWQTPLNGIISPSETG